VTATVRFTMRLAPDGDTAPAAMYQAALEMAVLADQAGAQAVVVSEHHGSDDGYLPSPLVLASAVAARTQQVPIVVSALLGLFYDPVHLAEDLAVLDILSGGRLVCTLGIGYRPEELQMFGVDPKARGDRMVELIGFLRAAWSGDPVDHPTRGRMTVTPRPHTPGGPMLMYGGHSKAAARRAARNQMLFQAVSDDPALAEAYDAEAARVGVEPLGCLLVAPGTPTSLFVADDVNAAWAEIGPALLNDAARYSEWNAARDGITSIERAQTVEDLRAGDSYVIVTPAELRARRAAGSPIVLDPLCGGLDPEVGMRYYQRALAAIAD
jgi:alkanesulfonate monooxygenase SsuD/methylene tetrahydromethanopterin reductase-like flavin-dependent oxidoreductase (luciferase family)